MPDHGTRRSYASGCHCVACRAANAAYVAAHRTVLGTVDASPARTHLEQLHALGLGCRQVALLAGVAARLVREVRSGRRPTLHPSTAARLLGVRPVLARGAAVLAAPTWRTIDRLEREGFTRRELAFHLGAHSQQLQLARRHVRVTTALRVQALHARLAG